MGICWRCWRPPVLPCHLWRPLKQANSRGRLICRAALPRWWISGHRLKPLCLVGNQGETARQQVINRTPKKFFKELSHATKCVCTSRQRLQMALGFALYALRPKVSLTKRIECVFVSESQCASSAGALLIFITFSGRGCYVCSNTRTWLLLLFFAKNNWPKRSSLCSSFICLYVLYVFFVQKIFFQKLEKSEWYGRRV